MAYINNATFPLRLFLVGWKLIFKNILYIYKVFGATQIVGQSKIVFSLNVNKDTSDRNGLHLQLP